jgi:dipeptidyl aminopeptidase/acylaminoacyl peptidase
VLAGGERQVVGADRRGGTLALAVADPGSWGELYAGSRRLTSWNAGFEALPMDEVTASAPDGYPVHGWVVRPPRPGPHPVLLMIHGGPFTQYGWRLFDEAQVYAAAGYAVVMGNPRGSSGYGEAHGRAIIGDVGAASAADLMTLLDQALKAEDLDGARVGVLGGSHGGFMTTWLAAHHGDRFRAAISERAVNAIDSFTGSSDIGWFFADRLWGTDPAKSPLAYADAISVPLLIVHSEHDWRCPVEQAQRLYVALKLRGAQVEMLLFPGEGHELSRSGRPSHRIARFEAILDWFGRWV